MNHESNAGREDVLRKIQFVDNQGLDEEENPLHLDIGKPDETEEEESARLISNTKKEIDGNKELSDKAKIKLGQMVKENKGEIKKPENENIVDQKLLYLEESMISVKDKIELSYKENLSLDGEIENKLSHFNSGSERKYGNILNEDFKDINSYFRSKVRVNDDFPKSIMHIIGEYKNLKNRDDVSKVKKLEFGWKMLIELKKRYEEYQNKLKLIKLSLEQKLQEHSYKISGEMRRNEQDRIKLSDLQIYNSNLNAMKRNLSDMFLGQWKKTSSASKEIDNEILQLKEIFVKITKTKSGTMEENNNSGKTIEKK